MSAQHTPGRLIGADENGNFNSNHEWTVTHNTATFSTCAPLWLDGEVAALVVDASENFRIDRTVERANRMVACWNALEDLSQAALDGGWTRAGLEAHAQKLEQQARQMQAQRDELLKVLEGLTGDIQALMGESEGVAGLHLNGDVAPWGELEAGGRFERLTHLPAAHVVIAKVEGGAA